MTSGKKLVLSLDNRIWKEGRRQLVLILLIQGEEYILGMKSHWYPQGFARMLGGGVEEGEDFLSAAVREIYEETTLKIPYENMVFVREWDIEVRYASHEGVESLQVQVFVSSIRADVVLLPQDDIDGFMRFNHQEFSAFLRYWDSRSSQTEKEWQDYWSMMGPIHRDVWDYYGRYIGC